MNYRLDGRDKKQFVKDIRESHAKELDIVLRICYEIKQKQGYWPILRPYGSDYTGGWVSSPTSDPDFKIEDKIVEITNANPKCQTYFHQKVRKVNKAISLGSEIIFVDGYKTENPQYTWMNNNDVRFFSAVAFSTYGIKIHPGKKSWTGKEAYRYCVKWFAWKPLLKLPKDIDFPVCYQGIIDGFSRPDNTKSVQMHNVRGRDTVSRSSKRRISKTVSSV